MTDADVIEGEVISEEDIEAGQHLPAVRAAEAMVARGEITVEDLVAQRDKVQQVMDTVMKVDIHYGKIPGVSKPSLWKPGAELCCSLFRLAPEYQSEKIFHDDGHLTVISLCTLKHAPTGIELGQGEGLCTTKESRYAFRNAQQTCPECGNATIFKSKHPPRDMPSAPPGFFCWKTKGGCGANYAHDDARITEQATGKQPNPDLSDQWNTVLKMAAKRALVAAVLVCTGASDIFTQDVEDGTAPPDETRTNDQPAQDPVDKMRTDIEQLLRDSDKMRKLEGGSTFAELEIVCVRDIGGPWTELTPDELQTIGTKLGEYVHVYVKGMKAAERPSARTFDSHAFEAF